MKISVVVPTYNEEDVIEDCLKSLSKQSYSDFEVIVVDDGSSDGTLKKLQNSKTPKIKVLTQQHKGAGAGRNLGAKQASGDILVFVDSDMTFDKNFLKMLIKPIVAGKTKGTFSKDEIVSNWDKPFARCYSINEGWENEIQLRYKKRHPKNYPDTQKVFRSILKSEFDSVGGFTPGGYNDDWSLSEKLSYEATVAEKAIFFHKNPETLKEIFKHAQWVGKRSYKLGALGYLIALIRSSFPVSLVLGILRSTFYMLPAYLIFKIVYDFGVFIGITKYIFTKRGSK